MGKVRALHYSATVNDKASLTTPNLETLFVTISHNSNPITVGVLYRPPNGNINDSLTELATILEALPKKSVYLMGDFNINLHKDNSKAVSDFEEVILSTGYTPLISVYTHEKPGCNETCIDNILTNEVESILLSGTIKDKLLHHLPIFQLFDWKVTGSNEIKNIQYCTMTIATPIPKILSTLSKPNLVPIRPMNLVPFSRNFMK